jgi:hypothetical protein
MLDENVNAKIKSSIIDKIKAKGTIMLLLDNKII